MITIILIIVGILFVIYLGYEITKAKDVYEKEMELEFNKWFYPLVSQLNEFKDSNRKECIVNVPSYLVLGKKNFERCIAKDDRNKFIRILNVAGLHYVNIVNICPSVEEGVSEVKLIK